MPNEHVVLRFKRLVCGYVMYRKGRGILLLFLICSRGCCCWLDDLVCDFRRFWRVFMCSLFWVFVVHFYAVLLPRDG